MNSLVFVVIIIATIIDGNLAGAGLDQVIKQLPARKQIGVVAYSEYFMAADLANGRYWYGFVGISAYILTLGFAFAGYLLNVDSTTIIWLIIAAAFALVHALGTSQAAPTAFSVRNAINNEDSLTEIFDKFSKWTSLRGIAGVSMFIAMVGALITITQ